MSHGNSIKDFEDCQLISIVNHPRDSNSLVDDHLECPVCLEPFTKEGDHRIVATKCGHLFGHSCIMKSLNQNSECPKCRKKNKKRDIILLYDTKIVAIDSSTLDPLRIELASEKEKKRKV